MDIEKKYYSPVPIIEYGEKIGSPAIGIAGGKSNGKTYGIILYYLKQRLENGRVLRYLRRYRESISPKALQSLCKPQKQNLINLTGGRFNDFQYFQNRFWFVRRDDSGKIAEKDRQPFMICSALNSVEANTGADEGECSAVFYDEFLSREKEIADEFYNLMIFYSNCTRNRVYYCPLILVGNTVTRDSSLITNFGVDMYNLKKGEITVVKNSKKEPVIVFEYCDEVEVMKEAGDAFYSRFENDRIKMIYKGDWTTGAYPYLAKQERDNSRVPVRLKIVLRDKIAMLFEFHLYNDRMYGYVCKYDDDNIQVHATLINKIQVFKDRRIFNYLPSGGIFRQFTRLVYTKNVYFENLQTGEYFRDFLKNFRGAENISNVYK